MYKYKFLQVGTPFEHAPVAYDQKAMALLSPMERCLSTAITELLLLPKFDNSSPSVTRDKEICHMIMS